MNMYTHIHKIYTKSCGPNTFLKEVKLLEWKVTSDTMSN